MSASRVVRQIRRDVRRGLETAGFRMALRRRWTIYDFDEGSVNHCPRCYKEAYENATDANCPVCYGTSFEGGYKPVELVWAVVIREGALDENREPGGIYYESQQNLKVQYPPSIQDGDIAAEIRELDDEKLVEVGQVYIVEAGVTQQQLSGQSNSNIGEYKPEDSVVSQSISMKPVFPDNLRAQPEFWYVDE